MGRKTGRAAAIESGHVEDLSADGRGVVRAGGKTVFVHGALPGEEVEFRRRKRRRSYDEAELITVLTAAPERVAPRCPHFGNCGGCSLQHLSTEQQLVHKQKHLLECLRRIGSVTPESVLEPLASEPWGYRRRARLGVKDVAGKGRVLVGFREKFAPYVADMDSCETLVPAAARLLAPLADLIATLSIRRELPQIEVAAGDTSLVLVLRVLAPPTPEDERNLLAFAAEHELYFYLQTGGLDSVRPLTNEPAELQFHLDDFGVQIDFEPTDFVQINGPLNRRLVRHVVDLLEPGSDDRVLELFAGLGNFSLPLARSGATVITVEGEHSLVARAEANAERNNLSGIRTHVADLFEPFEDAAWAHESHDLVLLDPPRVGAARVSEWLARGTARRIAYVSCHPATLARDAATIVSGGYTLSAAGVMDMFPHTAHVESLAIFDRNA